MESHPGRNGFILVVLSVVVFVGGAFFVGQIRGSGSSALGWAVMFAALALWLAAAVVQLRGLRGSTLPWLVASVGAYVIAFFLPSANDGRVHLGFDAFYQALAFVTLSWLANPVYLFGLGVARQGSRFGAFLVFLVAIVLGFSVRSSHPGIDVLVGFYVWLAAPAIAAFGCLVDLVTQGEPTVSQGSFADQS